MSRFSGLPSRENVSERLQGIRDAISGKFETAASTDPQYAKRDPAFRPQVAAKPKAATPAKPTAKPDPAAAMRMAKSEARARHGAVMASDAVAGREKQAADLLLASCSANAKFKSSKAIIAELQNRPTDAALVGHHQTKAESESDAIWARAWVVADTNQLVHGSKASANERDIDAMWARAYSRVSA